MPKIESILIWESGYEPPETESDAISIKVFTDIADLDLVNPSSLIFHIVELNGCQDGPGVLVYGKNGSDDLHCEYYANLEYS